MKPTTILTLAAFGVLGWFGYHKVYKPRMEAKAESRQLHKAFFRAVLDGDCDRVKRLLEAGVDVQAKDDQGRTALEISANKGWSALTKMLQTHAKKIQPEPQKPRTRSWWPFG